MLSRAILRSPAGSKAMMTASQSTTAVNGRASFEKTRTVYQDKMGDLRKQWINENKTKLDRRSSQKEEETRRIVLSKAMKIRERRLQAVKSQEVNLQKQREQRKLYEERLGRSLLRQKETKLQQQERYKQLLQDLSHEKDTWITSKEKIETMITPELFERAATTGFSTPHSAMWKTQVITFAMNRIISPELQRFLTPETEEDRNIFFGQKYREHETLVEELLEGYVTTGEDRLRVRQVAKEISKSWLDLEEQNADEDYEDEKDFRELELTDRLGYEVEYDGDAEANDIESAPMEALETDYIDYKPNLDDIDVEANEGDEAEDANILTNKKK